MHLGSLSEIGRQPFKKKLDISTRALRDKVQSLSSSKSASGFFGISRKVINIYLHNAFYNRYLCDEHQLDRLEPWLEVPIDSHVAKGLRKIARRKGVEIPESISGAFRIWQLTPTTHEVWQELASEVARALGTQRVHLDAYLYRS
jgi:hypothetical protein